MRTGERVTPGATLFPVLVMLKFVERVSNPEPAQRTLTLNFDQRQKARLKVNLDDGTPAALFLPRGLTLRGGDVLQSDDGERVAIVSAPERVSTVHCSEPRQLARAAYHLGNRHVAVQVGEDWLRYVSDHVLDDMLRSFGLEIRIEEVAFEPESGAYHSHHH